MKDESSPSLGKQLVALQEQLRIEFELAQIAEGKTLFPHCGTCTQADAPLQRGKLTDVVRAMLASLDLMYRRLHLIQSILEGCQRRTPGGRFLIA